MGNWMEWYWKTKCICHNTFIGTESGYLTKLGRNNVCIGNRATPKGFVSQTVDSENEIVLGMGAIGHGSHIMTIGGDGTYADNSKPEMIKLIDQQLQKYIQKKIIQQV